MNLINFNPSVSKIQYDGYKYKLDEGIVCNLDGNLSYNKRRLHKYRVNEVIYDLRTEDLFKYLFHVEVNESSWNQFKDEGYWEYYLSSLNLLDYIIKHIVGLVKFNRFTEVILPEELKELDLYSKLKICNPNKVKSPKTLEIGWFSDEFNGIPNSNHINLAIFHN